MAKVKNKTTLSQEEEIRLLASLASKHINNEKTASSEKVKTNLAVLDYVFGNGIGLSSVVQLVGGEHSGKTTVASYCANKIMEYTEKPILYLDFEGQLDPEWFYYNTGKDLEVHQKIAQRILNGDAALDLSDERLKKLIYYWRGEGLEGMNALREMNSGGAFSCVIIDSLSSMRFPQELTEEYDKTLMAQKARFQTKMLDTIEHQLSLFDTVFFIINQYRANLTGYGSARIIPGPYKLRHSSVYIMEMKQLGGASSEITDASGILGTLSEIKCTKNKRGVKYRSGNLAYLFPKNGAGGLDPYYNNALFLTDNNVIQKKGSWYVLNEETSVQGVNNVVKYLREHPDYMNKTVNSFLNELEKGSGLQDYNDPLAALL